MIRLRYTVALLFSFALLSGASKLAPSQHTTPARNTSSIVQVADDEGASSDGTATDPDTVEQGPDGDGNVEG
jgi:hypothetical protein